MQSSDDPMGTTHTTTLVARLHSFYFIYLQLTLFVPMLDITKRLVVMTVWMIRVLDWRRGRLLGMFWKSEYSAQTAICCGCFVGLALPRRLICSRHVLKKRHLLPFVLLLGDKCCRFNECHLYLSIFIFGICGSLSLCRKHRRLLVPRALTPATVAARVVVK